MADWIVAVAERVQPAIENLSEAGYAVYAPRYRERRGRRWRDRWLLGRYLLVERAGAWGRQYHFVVRLRGVRSVLRCDEGPLLVRESEVMGLKGRENRRGYVSVVKPPRFVAGVPVRITAGLFAGKVGRYVGEDGAKDRIEVDMLGRVQGLVLPEGCLVAG